jgi:hypothetical protein
MTPFQVDCVKDFISRDHVKANFTDEEVAKLSNIFCNSLRGEEAYRLVAMLKSICMNGKDGYYIAYDREVEVKRTKTLIARMNA